MLAKTDRAMLTQYCYYWAQFVETSKLLDQMKYTVMTDKGNLIQHPMVAIVNKASERLEKLSREFGLSPSARASLKTKEPQPAGDPQEKFLRLAKTG